MRFLPTLYKKTSTGAIQFWKISIHEDSDHSRAWVIRTEYGQVGTPNPQLGLDTIWEGKNIGKKNETDCQQQAWAEAMAKHEKQQKKGYVHSIEMAQADGLSSLIEGGVIPMLAHKFADHGHKTKFPCYVQPKLDGIRCIAIVKDGKCTLWSRTRKAITGVPHIQRELEMRFKQDVILDGELYNHDLKKDFEKIVSMVRQEKPADGHEIVQYHIYDVVQDKTYEFRWKWIYNQFEHISVYSKDDPLRMVNSFNAQTEEDVNHWFGVFTKEGYEGCMVRNADGKYVNKRSYDLLKVKEFEDAEFEICGIDEGRGKLSGHVGAFRCITSDGKEFLAKMAGETERLRDYFQDHSLWQGKKLTVKYQGLTGANGVPRFPVGVSIRDYE